MSAQSQAAEQASSAAAASGEQNNNSLSSNGNDKLESGGASPPGRGLASSRKRASVQSNLSAASANGNHSLVTSGSSQAGDDDDDEDCRAQMSSAEYEHIRNKTLLFFLDRLYLASQEGKEARTLHDLSCLFGTREFTKEMRQIVGASRNGLKKFLQSYPSLFQIEGDKVHLTQLKEEAQVVQRDYNKEAVEYFKQKLLQFGSSLVPIKNLFGYRSQASQEVRHVSGKNSRDFKRFLKQNEDVFEILADEHVVLKSALQELESQGMSSLSLQQSLQPVPAEEATTLDPYLNKQLAHLIEDFIRQMVAEARPPVAEDQFRVTLEQLHARVHQQCHNELFLKMVKSVENLRVFLRMHPKLFKRIPAGGGQEANEGESLTSLNAATCYVGLLSESERRDLETQAYQASTLMQRQHSTLSAQQPQQQQQPQPQQPTSPTKSTAEEKEPASLPVESAAANPATTSEAASEKAKLARTSSQSQPVAASVVKAENGQEKAKQPLRATPTSEKVPQGQSAASQQSASHKLRANAPPFVPSRHQATNGQASLPPIPRQNSLLTQGHRSQANAPSSRPQTAIPPPPIQRSVSNLNSGGQYQEQAYSKRQAELPPYDRRTAIRSYLMKGNTGANGHNMNWGQQQQQQQQQQQGLRAPMPSNQPLESQGQRQRQWSSSANQGEHGAAGGNQEDLRARTVDIVREASNIITKIMTTTDAVAFDCKGYNLGFDGKITLIQFGFLPTKQVDPMQLANSMNKRFASSAPTPATPHHASAAAAAAAAAASAASEAADKENQLHEDVQSEKHLKPEVCVFDLITNPELAYCLKPLLESDKVVKIVHDVRNKSNALHVQFNIILNNVFDTQVANLVIQQQVTGKPAYKSRYISMGKLCEIYGSDELVKYRNMIKIRTSTRGSSSRGSSSSSKDVNYWRARPLTRNMVLEATMDVYCLVGGIYQNLKARIKPEYEPLFDLLNLEGVLARIKPEEIRSAKKERKIDMEVIDLKRKLYGDTMGPVVLSNREIRLLRHIDLTEGVRQKIQQCKKVAKKLERLDSKAALLKQQLEGGADGTEGDPQAASLNSHSSSSKDSSLNVTTGSGPSSYIGEHEQRQEQLRARMDEFNAAVMMMDGSMFDELNHTINESTNLLESLENDDEDEEAQLSSGHHSHNGSSINDCCRCQCHSGSQAQSSLESAAGQRDSDSSKSPKTTNEEKESGAATREANASSNAEGPADEEATGESASESRADNSSKLSDQKPSDNTRPEPSEAAKADEQVASNDEDSDDSKSSACDMAVQCDLLS